MDSDKSKHNQILQPNSIVTYFLLQTLSEFVVQLSTPY